MRVEVCVASPEPTVGVFTIAGTCQGRLGDGEQDERLILTVKQQQQPTADSSDRRLRIALA